MFAMGDCAEAATNKHMISRELQDAHIIASFADGSGTENLATHNVDGYLSSFYPSLPWKCLTVYIRAPLGASAVYRETGEAVSPKKPSGVLGRQRALREENTEVRLSRCFRAVEMRSYVVVAVV